MIENIDIPFEVNDIVWRKNLVTNEAIQTVVKSYTAIINSDGSKCVLFHVVDKFTAIESLCVNIIEKPKNTNIFATKEECDSYPPYVPGQD